VIPIGLEELAKTIHAFRFGPDDVWGGTKYMFEVGPKGGYEKVFGEPASPLSEGDFRLLAGSYFACEEIRSLWEEAKRSLKDNDEPPHPALERRWMVYYTVGELLRLGYKEQEDALDEDLRRLSKPQWLDASDNESKDCLAELYNMATSALRQTYDIDARATENFRHRNWFRSESTLRQIQSTLATIPAYRGPRNPMPKLR
jgi:hypothetical protein